MKEFRRRISKAKLFSFLHCHSRLFQKAFNFLLNVHVLAYRQLIKSHGAASEHFKWHMSDGKLLSNQRAFFADESRYTTFAGVLLLANEFFLVSKVQTKLC